MCVCMYEVGGFCECELSIYNQVHHIIIKRRSTPVGRKERRLGNWPLGLK